MKRTLRFRFTAAFMAFTLLLILFIGLIVNLIYGQFSRYFTSRQEETNKSIVESLSAQYIGGGFNLPAVENIGVYALGNGLILRLKDKSGTVVWDARIHNSGMCAEIIEQMARTMHGQNPTFQGGYVEKTYAVTAGWKTVGSVVIGYYGPYFYSELDVQFINRLNSLFLFGGLIAVLISLLLGWLLAKRLASPIARVTAAAKRIAGGDLGSRIGEAGDTIEISTLTESVNVLADSLAKQEEIRRRMTSDVAHELRTPIATLQSHLEAMIDGVWAPDTERLQSCHEETVRLGKLVGGLERIAKAESENFILNKTEFDLGALLRRLVMNFESTFQKKGVALSLSAGVHTLIADEDRIESVFTNLLENALKYTDSGGEVDIAVEEKTEKLFVSVADSGSGIPEEDLPYIFERFYRADKSRSRLTGGYGIGLAIVKSIIEAHRGEIMVQSERGKGSRFTVVLPRKPEVR